MSGRELWTGIQGICMGIIICALVTGASSEEVAIILLPATLILGASIIIDCVRFLRGRP